jgi:hypothetical protein
MRKLALGLFIVYSICSFGSGEVKLDKEVVGVNKSQLEEKNISRETVVLDEESVEERNSEFISNNKTSGEEKIKVTERDKSRLTKEVSTIEKKEKKKGGALKWILGAIGVTAALVVAL